MKLKWRHEVNTTSWNWHDQFDYFISDQRNPIPASLFAELLEETEEDMEQALAVSPRENAVQAWDIECTLIPPRRVEVGEREC